MKKTRPKPYKIQRGRSRGRYRKAKAVWIYNRTSLQKHTKKKKDGGKEEKKKDKDVFPPYCRPRAMEKETSDARLMGSG